MSKRTNQATCNEERKATRFSTSRGEECVYEDSHERGRALVDVLTPLIESGKSKITQQDLRAVLTEQDVLWLDITVADSKIVTECDGVEDLEVDHRDEGRSTQETSLPDRIKEISSFGEVEDEEVVGLSFDHQVNVEDVGVGGAEAMKLELLVVEGSLSDVEPFVAQTLYGWTVETETKTRKTSELMTR